MSDIKQKTDFNIYTGSELRNLPPLNTKALIKDLLWERDNIIVLGKEKAGKSILVQQMAFNMSCGEPFLGKYPTIKSCVLYVQVEGKLRGMGGTQERIKNMEEAISWEQSNFNLIYMPGLLINTDEGMKRFEALIKRKLDEGMPVPKVIVFDPLYQCMYGDMTSQPDSSRMTTNLRIISDTYDCTLIIIHHTHRDKFTDGGQKLDEGSGSIFGSFVWGAFADHILLFKKTGKLTRELICDVQRSGVVKDRIDMTFIEPIPLLFEEKGEVEPYINIVEAQLSNKPNTTERIVNTTNLPYHSVNKALVWLRKQGKIKSMNSTYPKEWIKV